MHLLGNLIKKRFIKYCRTLFSIQDRQIILFLSITNFDEKFLELKYIDINTTIKNIKFFVVHCRTIVDKYLRL